MNMETINENMKECLEKLKDSQIVKEDYQMHMGNLCDAIQTITSQIRRNVDYIAGDIKRGDYNIENMLNAIKEVSFQIDTVSTIIQEKISYNDFVELADLIHEYKNTLE